MNTLQNTEKEIIIWDVTLRDGLQSLPWWHYPTSEDRAVHVQNIENIGMQHQEIGFPAIVGDPEFEACKHTIERNSGSSSTLFWLARLMPTDDIRNAHTILRWAKKSGIHTFIGTSPEHLMARNMTEKEVISLIKESVTWIVENGHIAQFSPEDATRTEKGFLLDALGAASDSGATFLNVPDTLWVHTPLEYLELIRMVRVAFPDILISVHPHDDRWAANMNAILPIREWIADKVEWTLFGIGERAGNADIWVILWDIVSAPWVNFTWDAEAFWSALQFFSEASGIYSKPVDPMYGTDCVMARSGIHQSAVAKMKKSYVWTRPDRLWLHREMFGVSPLSWGWGVEQILTQSEIPFEKSALADITLFLRSIFSPDTYIQAICVHFNMLDEEEVVQLSHTVQDIRRETRTLIPTSTKVAYWNDKTLDIVRSAVEILHSHQKW